MKAPQKMSNRPTNKQTLLFVMYQETKEKFSQIRAHIKLTQFAYEDRSKFLNSDWDGRRSKRRKETLYVFAYEDRTRILSTEWDGRRTKKGEHIHS